MEVKSELDNDNASLEVLYSMRLTINNDYRIFLQNPELEIQCRYDFRREVTNHSNQDSSITVVGPNKGTQIKEFFPYLGQNSKISQIRECPKFPYVIRNTVKNC